MKFLRNSNYVEASEELSLRLNITPSHNIILQAPINYVTTIHRYLVVIGIPACRLYKMSSDNLWAPVY